MSAKTQIDKMQIVAYNATNSLYWDSAETEVFYLYDKVNNALQTLSIQTAKTWFDTNPQWTMPGCTFWGKMNGPLINQGQTNG
jgi:hypothetical protein